VKIVADSGAGQNSGTTCDCENGEKKGKKRWPERKRDTKGEKIKSETISEEDLKEVPQR